MEFFTVNGKRPCRLRDATRRFAYESLHHKYGLQTKETMTVSLDDIDGFERMSPIRQYDAAIARIADTAPIRICEGELLSGAATLGQAIHHMVPASFGGRVPFYSVSHLTIDFETVLKKGVCSLREDVLHSLKIHGGTEREPFLHSCLNCIDSMKRWHARYLDALRGMDGYEDNYTYLKNVPFAPARNFREALQSLWFTFAFVRLCGNWPGIGRIDYLLGDYLERDLASGVLTADEARELLAHFLIKGCEWVCGGDYGSGDAQHYQNLVLCGVDEHGNEVANTVTYLILDILEETGISDFPTTVRIGRHTDEKLMRRVAEVLRFGGGVLAVYNEELVIDSLVGYGYPVEEARKFANDGCWEVQIPGKTYFIYTPFDALQILQKKTLGGYGETVDFDSYESLYRQFANDLREHVASFGDTLRTHFSDTQTWKHRPQTPCTVVSLFEQGCIEKGLSYTEGGPVYRVHSPHIGGLPDAVNSLYAIKKLVFDEQKISFAELMQALRNNWEGNEPLRRYALGHYVYYGNDNDEVDCIAQAVVKDFADACDEISGKCGYMTPAGVSTFGRQLEWSPYRLATASGRKAHDILSGNFSPAPGTDREGATAIVKSYCKSDLKQTVSGAALDIKLLPSAVAGENGIEALVSLMRGFVLLGGHFMQPDIADTALLKAAQEHPEDYQTLSVRVSGWNARFVTLCKEWQDMIIAQTGGEL